MEEKFKQKFYSQQNKEKKKYLCATAQVLYKSQKHTASYTTTVCGREFIVLPNVFSPKYFYDTEIFTRWLLKNKKYVDVGKSFCEIGSGTGAVSVSVALTGVNVTAVDINEQAVRNTRLNVQKYNVADRVHVFVGNIFDPFMAQQKFDTIFWNTPFGFIERADLSPLEKSVFDSGYKATEQFLRQAPQHLKPQGTILIGYSNTLGDVDLLQNIARSAKLHLQRVKQTKSVEVHPVTFDLYEVVTA
ncbi:MAG: hypothetical protein A2233_01485 [Candidatus Kerfeldbacteria bacterium RIFOXYA2_FULL_38_24]|uniref:Methyltransferase small domain-containing protein n=1 Tax=Candidatus Kerfeldbacteria bacterium RIFOXYB2_FULL_38_14 TaxID=1798547 RepID=A0A1G2BGS5_9BACT|nr:MAG: hypothetical protein A2233_01485 [Candidatus Kerfeldbacteria bacterium RIFOXYA2_FULL_38_24]OGY87407.1 MAG: hypothetical protein A2319_05575 [Candidatus Kerfeldbacteria bacterium RIFOXYB2_FULL_38_14]OGY90357.1 MAG: hypothetical protein A2458_04480 [Candidatus Kerfeldbacteria bacterium RIFOXYC2_FULL_38_9]